LRTYELVLVVQPGLDEEGLDAFVNTFTGMVDEAGGQVVDMEHMGRRRLAYPIRKRPQKDTMSSSTSIWRARC